MVIGERANNMMMMMMMILGSSTLLGCARCNEETRGPWKDSKTETLVTISDMS